ncbi:hypothetical protein Dimus_005442 [Dionaea muscipula]
MNLIASNMVLFPKSKQNHGTRSNWKSLSMDTKCTSNHGNHIATRGYMDYGYVSRFHLLTCLKYFSKNLWPLITDVSIIDEDAELELLVTMRYLIAVTVITKQWSAMTNLVIFLWGSFRLY